MKKTYWGILGTGRIAHAFTRTLLDVDNAVVHAVGSRTKKAATAFAERYHIPHRYESYQELMNDAQVDVIYVSTPHSLHYENTLAALEAGKAVLCEKPLAVNAAQAREMIETARQKHLFLMEAMWTRFLPAIERVREWIESDKIGPIHLITADFGFRIPFKAHDRVFDPKLAGGALLDVGIYPVSLTSMLMGRQPEFIASTSTFGQTNVDEMTALIFRYPQGQIASLTCSINTRTPSLAFVQGREGFIQIDPRFWAASQVSLIRGQEKLTYESPYPGTGFQYEARHVMHCLEQGKTESEIMPLDESLQIMQTMDLIREQTGLIYPFEK